MSEYITDSEAAAQAHELAFTRFYVASPDQVFEAWTRRHRLARWWGPEGSRLTTCDVGRHAGGRFRLVARDAGGAEHAVDGTLLALTAPTLLVYAARGEEAPDELLRTTVTFDEMGAMTRMTVRQAIAASEERAERQSLAWLERLTRLSEHLESS